MYIHSKKALGVLLILIISSPAVFAGDEIDALKQQVSGQEEELSFIETEISHLRSRLRLLTEREKELTEKLDELDRQINARQARLSRLRSDIDSVSRRIFESEEAIRKKERQKTGHGEDIQCLARAYYYRSNRNARRSWVSLIFGEENRDDFVLAYMTREPVSEYVRTEAEIRRTIEETEQLRLKNIQLAGLKRELIEIQDEFIEKRRAQLDIVKEIRQQQANRQQEISRMEEEKQKLKELIESLRYKAESLEALRQLAQDFTQGRGMLPWPVRGEVVSRFGRQRHPTLDTHIYNRGIEIEVPGSAEVMAVAGGEVVFAQEFRGRGNMVVIDHGNNYYTIYGGLDSIRKQVGSMTEPLDTIGSVSDCLYFELGRESEPDDPLRWLK